MCHQQLRRAYCHPRTENCHLKEVIGASRRSAANLDWRARSEMQVRFAAGAKRHRLFQMAIRSCRAAGNRTRSKRTPCARTTGILRPELRRKCENEVFAFPTKRGTMAAKWPSSPKLKTKRGTMRGKAFGSVFAKHHTTKKANR